MVPVLDFGQNLYGRLTRSHRAESELYYVLSCISLKVFNVV